jgi:undecaprenol kinase
MINLQKMFRSFGPAFNGLKLLATENNFRVHLLAFACVVVAGLVLAINLVDWAILLVCVAMVLTAEAINSAIESVVDLASPTVHPLARKAKDIAAAAVLITAIFSVLVAVVIFGKYLG